VVGRVLCLAALKFRVERKHGEPGFGGIPRQPHLRPGISEQQPSALGIECEHVGYDVGPSLRELDGEARFERLNRRACLEPDDPAANGNPENGRPRPLVVDTDRARDIRVPADPGLGLRAIASCQTDGFSP
jgi:hypothetical protein